MKDTSMQSDRRTVVKTGAVLAGALLTPIPAQAAQKSKDENGKEATTPSADRKAIMAAGLNEQEADCWRAIAEAAGALFELEELHPMDKAEVANAVHIIQNKLLSRPTYRTYIATHKKMQASKESKPQE